MIRNVVLHLNNEQPMLADLFGVPTANDAGLLCTNLRLMDGKRPVFIDNIAATFFLPYLHVRFLEIPPGALDEHRAEGGAGILPASAAPRAETPPAGSALPVPVADNRAPAEDEIALQPELEIDEDFLQRIRDL